MNEAYRGFRQVAGRLSGYVAVTHLLVTICDQLGVREHVLDGHVCAHMCHDPSVRIYGNISCRAAGSEHLSAFDWLRKQQSRAEQPFTDV
jgi:hypothetical protein